MVIAHAIDAILQLLQCVKTLVGIMNLVAYDATVGQAIFGCRIIHAPAVLALHLTLVFNLFKVDNDILNGFNILNVFFGEYRVKCDPSENVLNFHHVCPYPSKGLTAEDAACLQFFCVGLALR